MCALYSVSAIADINSRLLIEWNLAVFDTFAPRAWARLLAVLVEHSETTDIWSAWPDSSKTGNLYWENLPHQLALEVAKQDLAIFPKIVAQDVGSGTVYVGLRDSLVASAEFSEGVLRVLAKAGLVIIQPPLSVLRLLKLANHQILTRSTIHRALQVSVLFFIPNYFSPKSTGPHLACREPRAYAEDPVVGFPPWTLQSHRPLQHCRPPVGTHCQWYICGTQPDQLRELLVHSGNERNDKVV